MTYRTPERIGALGHKGKEILNDVGYDIDLAGRNLQQGIHKVIFNRRLSKLGKIGAQIWEQAQGTETTWQDGESTIHCALYEDKDMWRLMRSDNGLVVHVAQITLEKDKAPHVVSHRYGPNGAHISAAVAIGSEIDDYRKLSGAVKDVLDFIGSADRLLQLPKVAQD